MILIREVLVAKPGKASTLAKLMKEVFPEGKVMTDMTGVFNTVVMETEIKDFAEFEDRMKDYMSNPKFKEQMKGYTDLYDTGKREIFSLVE